MSVDYRPDYDPADVDSDYGHTGGDITVPTFTANMKPFRFWCQKALPLVYDDSLSYYEVLCKVVKQMNDFLTDLQTATGAIDEFAQQFVINQQFLNDMADQLGQNVQDLEDYINDRLEDYMTAYTQLQDYVNNYFDNLDVQQEINNKLDEMASDGTFNTLFDPVITAWMTTKTAQIDAAIAAQNAVQAQQNGRISILEGRMDTFAGLPAGSTSGNAELLDIRTNFLGETYPTAGDAVRASDMIASGFQAIPATLISDWDGNDESSVYDTIQIDISAYKGGHIVVIGTFLYFQYDIQEIGKCSVYATNISGATEDTNAVNYAPGSAVFKSLTQITTAIQDEERLLLQFAIPEDYSYQYLKIGHVEHTPNPAYYTDPLYIVYGNSWSKTPVDDTLSIPGDAADAKATGDALEQLNERLSSNSVTIGDEVFNETELTTTSDLILEGWKLTNDGYRVADANYKLVHFRVFEGDYVKVVSDHKFQFQNSTTVTTSGTLYRVGNTFNDGVLYSVVPATATYVVVSTPMDSEAHVYKLTSTIDELIADDNNTVNRFLDVYDDIQTIGDSVYEVTEELASIGTLELNGYKLTDDGYRVTDAGYKIECFRVFEGNFIKVISDHKIQFQNSSTITASGTLYRIGRTMQTGTFYLKVPATATYMVVSTPVNSGAHVYSITEVSEEITEQLENTESTINGNKARIAEIYNAYTSQISDIPYNVTASIVRLGIDTETPSFVSGSGYVICIPIMAGTSIRVKKPQSPVCIIGFTSEYPKNGTEINHYTSMTGVVNTEFVAVSETGDNYLTIYTGTTAITDEDCTFAYSQTARGTVELLPQLDWRMINLLKYRPVGKVSKAYIALSCDDGHNSLATYTLPRIQYWNNYYNANIPLHMALFDNAPVFANAEYTALVTDMCENHNCSIGIHGTQPYENYTITNLYAYLKKQWDTIIDKTGITPTSVIYPHSSYNDQIMVMTAGFCGICGASGSDASPYTYSDDQGLAFYVGEKSNCYEVYRLSIKDTRIGNATQAQRIIDYAIAHNLIICPYFHDDDFTEYSEATNEFNKAMLDAFIQYGMERGVEFVNFGDIPYLL